MSAFVGVAIISIIRGNVSIQYIYMYMYIEEKEGTCIFNQV